MRSVALVILSALICAGLAADTLNGLVRAREPLVCRDKSPEFRAVMARLPGESHSAEFCLQAMRFGSKDFVPEFGLPLPPDKMKLPTEGL